MPYELHKKLIDHFSVLIALSEEEKRLIQNSYKVRHVKRKEYLFEQGKLCQVEAFVITGCFRVFYVDLKGAEHVLYFAFPDWWVGDIAKFYSGDPTVLCAQALEDSTVLTIDHEEKEKLFNRIPQLERLFRIIAQKHLTVLQKRLILTYSATAAERYKELLERYPGIDQLVPQHQIASYLGILPESLSRMKKQLLR